MKNWFLRGPLFDDELGAGGDGRAVSTDMGAPFEHGAVEPEPAAAPKPAEKSDVEKRLDALERDNKAKDARIGELTQSEQYWANRARGAATPEVPADEPDDPPAPIESPFEGEKPEQLLDDLSVNGLKALHKRGLITTDQLVDELGRLEQRVEAKVDAKLAQASRHAAVDQELNKFPDLLADAKLVQAGQAPKTELYKLTQAYYREMLADDPGIKNSPAALLSAARRATKEIELEKRAAGGDRGDRAASRRERIERLAPDRDSSSGEGDGGGDEHLSPTQRTIVNSLSRFGIGEADFQKFAKEPVNGKVRH